jgi:PAS domain S-box-containing protein
LVEELTIIIIIPFPQDTLTIIHPTMKDPTMYIEAAAAVKIGIWKIDTETDTVYWDSITRHILEVPEDYVPTFELGIDFITEGESREKFVKLHQNAIANKTPFIGEFRVTTAKNNIKHVEYSCRTIVVDNKVAILAGTFQDITKEHNLIKELQLGVDKFSSVFYSAHDAIIIINSATGIISDCNYRSYELTGYTQSELVGLHKSELFPIDKRQEVRNFLNTHVEEDSYFIIDSSIKSNNGTVIPVELATGKKYTVDSETYVVCHFRNISDRKANEDKINMLSLVASETQDSIFITNPEGEAIWVNEAYTRLTGYSLEETVGKIPYDLLYGPETNFQTIQDINFNLENKKNAKVTILNYNKSKRKFWYESNITPVFDNRGDCTKFVSVGRDVTGRIEKEIELARIMEVTSQQNDKLLNFAHIVSHNIRSHTSNLLMVLDVIEGAENTDEKLSYMEMFKEGTEKLSETVEYLNEIITIQKNTNIEKKDICLYDEIEKTKITLSLIILESQIEITHSIPDDLTISVVPAYLDSILLNIFTNAIKYRSQIRKSFLKIGYEVNENYTIISFKDNGLGLNLKTNGHKIFEMYKTFHGNDDARGIGLCITKNQLEAMKGKIEMESEEGTGSIFKIYLNEK